MKIIKYLIILLLVISCTHKNSKDNLNKRWKVDVSKIQVSVEIHDIANDFYNLNFSISNFRKKYPFYLSQVTPDSRFERDRRDSMELNIYSEIKKKVANDKIKAELEDLFKHIKYYYPDFKLPTVYLYSSFTSDYLNPITYIPQNNYLLIATDCFLGYGNKYYDMMKIDRYIQRTMSMEYLSSKTAKEIIKGMALVPREITSQSFVSQMIYQGKILILEDAFLPEIKDCYKIGYTQDQINWARDNEFEIWNFFIENNYIFSDDISLSDRFLSLAPFSKFYTEVDSQSPGQIGCWTGWQICRKYLIKNDQVSLQEFIKNPNHEQIFAKSKYKPSPDAEEH
ncbi:hypothetical protein Ga0061079_10635 [Apibacter mensalis]|uniref:Gliding motility-associated lipoprotein GldB n=1 Tax=Apibacter mensalis TaxID=1586267 RepID=A0A0X3APF2_9FLAO|nr:hypothetical protein [Apibacter mensalis]CVK16270.1 hypothetical protein Ga0061079_10635 [Apibacter mensalis]